MSRSVSISGISSSNNKTNSSSYSNIRSASIGGSSFFNNHIRNNSTTISDHESDSNNDKNQELLNETETTPEKEIDIVGAISNLHLDEEEDDDLNDLKTTSSSDNLEPKSENTSDTSSSFKSYSNSQSIKPALPQQPYHFPPPPFPNQKPFNVHPLNENNSTNLPSSLNWNNSNSQTYYNGMIGNEFGPSSTPFLKLEQEKRSNIPLTEPAHELEETKEGAQSNSNSFSTNLNGLSETTKTEQVKEQKLNFPPPHMHPHQFNPFPPSPIGHPGAPPPPIMPFNYGPPPPPHLNHRQSPIDYHNFDINVGPLPPNPSTFQPPMNGESMWNNNNRQNFQNPQNTSNGFNQRHNTNFNGHKHFQQSHPHQLNNFLNNNNNNLNTFYPNGNHNNRKNYRNYNGNHHYNNNNGHHQNRSYYQKRGEDASKYFNHKAIDFKGSILNLCIDQHGCRFLQKELEEAENLNEQNKEELIDNNNPKESKNQVANLIFNEIQNKLIDLMIDPFGNYLIQKLINYLTISQKLKLIEITKNEFYNISINSHGTRTLQKLIDCCTTDEEIDLVISALKPYVKELSNNINGNHVIQKCLIKFTSHQNQFIYDILLKNIILISCHRHGCCVIQKSLDFASLKQKINLFKEISKNVEILIYDPYGNYVIQYILDDNNNDNNNDNDNDDSINKELQSSINKIIEYIKLNLVKVSTHKFSSNVIEKSLKTTTTTTSNTTSNSTANTTNQNQNIIINEILKLNKLDLNFILKDSYGNYVLQTCLNFANLNQFKKLNDLLLPFLPQIKNTPYGKRILNKLQ
ncbi:uncharacterized protein KGF55_005250 [Candida pseudojiufengensis]|uniref:uncharacterized protein n=1 Tax=Candida pseudojiufengensis TaxID=497109 RepID=UPI00222493BC|nr:uncharacterized protein KGF55_005250 [Candida pseudojiufengensis]KAI5959606.1 hypothetical protein KGF55_005250 [Candida pseudojiufengensis]